MSTSSSSDSTSAPAAVAVAEYGWTAVPRSQKALFNELKRSSDGERVKGYTADSIPLPDSPAAKKTLEYAKRELIEQTFNHSMRVYYYGRAILDSHFPDWKVSKETYLLCCLLHDIGTTSTNLSATRMSFEFYGANVAYRFLVDEAGVPIAQAESVTEAIIRHQDLGESGTITELGQLIQLATVFDNIGMNPELVATETIEAVVKAWPRNKWSGCFAQTVMDEIEKKPWCHTTAIPDFAENVEGNKLMQPY